MDSNFITAPRNSYVAEEREKVDMKICRQYQKWLIDEISSISMRNKDENLKVIDNKNIFQLFPDVQFYDYTKHPGRNLENKTAGNYDLTYSYSGITPHNITIKGILNPGNSRVAVVFDKAENIPSAFRGWPVIDGDNTDVRHIEPKTVVVALYAKGKAVKDLSGFTQIKGRDY